jgi:predicted nucleic acid-binding protein
VSHFAVIFDACVLHPAELRDFLMWLARTRLFRAKWTATIHDEWIRSVVRRRPDEQQEELRKRLLRTANIMNSAIPDSLVAGYESLITGIQLPDPDDRHVVAAAVFARAEVIVTFN